MPVADPRFDGIRDLADLSRHWLIEIENFFNTYKLLEHKETEVEGWQGVRKAWEILERYRLDEPE